MFDFIVYIYNTTLFQPLYNSLVFLTGIIPGNYIALAIIILTIGVKLILFPLYHQSVKTQAKLKEIDQELKQLKDKYKDDKPEQAKQLMELYRTHGINPFTTIILLFVQLPIILALFSVFQKGFDLHLDILYSFIPQPELINISFLGLFDISDKSLILALLVGITQFIQMKLSLPVLIKTGKKLSPQEEFTRNMNLQMKYVMPVIIVFISASFPSAISIYWLTSNLFAIGHEVIVRRKALIILNR